MQACPKCVTGSGKFAGHLGKHLLPPCPKCAPGSGKYAGHLGIHKGPRSSSCDTPVQTKKVCTKIVEKPASANSQKPRRSEVAKRRDFFVDSKFSQDHAKEIRVFSLKRAKGARQKVSLKRNEKKHKASPNGEQFVPSVAPNRLVSEEDKRKVSTKVSEALSRGPAGELPIGLFGLEMCFS